MTCETCVSLITDAVQLLPGVLQAHGDLAAGTFRVAYDAAQVTSKAIARAIEQAGKEGAWQHTYRAEALARPKQRAK